MAELLRKSTATAREPYTKVTLTTRERSVRYAQSLALGTRAHCVAGLSV